MIDEFFIERFGDMNGGINNGSGKELGAYKLNKDEVHTELNKDDSLDSEFKTLNGKF